MNKNELIDSVSDKVSKVSKKDIAVILDTVFACITEALQGKEKITLVGFGTFEPKERAARPGRNPRTGDMIEIPKSRQVKFNMGKALKDALKQ